MRNQLSELTAERARAIEQLEAVGGIEFDGRYLAQQARVHNTAMGAIQHIADLVRNLSTQFFVRAATPIMNRYHAMAQDLAR